MTTRFNTGSYIVVLETTAEAVRALLFDAEARRVEGYSAQLPRRADAAPDCLDEMHRLTHADGFNVAAVVGHAENLVTAEDREVWPGFAGASWFPALPEGAGVVMGSGSLGSFVLCADTGKIATVVREPFPGTVPIDDHRWLLSGAVADASAAYASLRKQWNGSIEAFLASASADNPLLAPLDAVAAQYRAVYDTLTRAVGRPPEVVGCGAALLKSPSWTQRLANALGVSITLCTEPEPVCRGAALWALDRLRVIPNMDALPASTAAVFEPALEPIST